VYIYTVRYILIHTRIATYQPITLRNTHMLHHIHIIIISFGFIHTHTHTKPYAHRTSSDIYIHDKVCKYIHDRVHIYIYMYIFVFRYKLSQTPTRISTYANIYTTTCIYAFRCVFLQTHLST